MKTAMPMVVTRCDRLEDGRILAWCSCPCCGHREDIILSPTRYRLGEKIHPCPACQAAGRVRHEDDPRPVPRADLGERIRVELGFEYLGVRCPVWAIEADGTETVYAVDRN